MNLTTRNIKSPKNKSIILNNKKMWGKLYFLNFAYEISFYPEYNCNGNLSNDTKCIEIRLVTTEIQKNCTSGVLKKLELRANMAKF